MLAVACVVMRESASTVAYKAIAIHSKIDCCMVSFDALNSVRGCEISVGNKLFQWQKICTIMEILYTISEN